LTNEEKQEISEIEMWGCYEKKIIS
jgi:hypothetical protein